MASSQLPDSIICERLILRAPKLDDALALQQLANNKNIHKFLERLPNPYRHEHAIDFINNLARSKEEHAYAIITKDKEFIGVAGYHLNCKSGVELGYWVGEPYWGKGYATEAVRALIVEARKIGVKQIFAHAISKNIASIRVLKKCGFIITKEKIDNCGPHKGVMVSYLKYENNNA